MFADAHISSFNLWLNACPFIYLNPEKKIPLSFRAVSLYRPSEGVFLSFFSLVKTIYPRVLAKPLPSDAKSPLPVDVRRWRPSPYYKEYPHGEEREEHGIISKQCSAASHAIITRSCDADTPFHNITCICAPILCSSCSSYCWQDEHVPSEDFPVWPDVFGTLLHCSVWKKGRG